MGKKSPQCFVLFLWGHIEQNHHSTKIRSSVTTVDSGYIFNSFEIIGCQIYRYWTTKTICNLAPVRSCICPGAMVLLKLTLYSESVMLQIIALLITRNVAKYSEVPDILFSFDCWYVTSLYMVPFSLRIKKLVFITVVMYSLLR